MNHPVMYRQLIGDCSVQADNHTIISGMLLSAYLLQLLILDMQFLILTKTLLSKDKVIYEILRQQQILFKTHYSNIYYND